MKLSSKVALEEVKHILHLPLIIRVVHPKSFRVVAGVSSGILFMISGSLIAGEKDQIALWLSCHHILVDTLGYFIHAAGAIPILRYVEPLWTLIVGAE